MLGEEPPAEAKSPHAPAAGAPPATASSPKQATPTAAAAVATPAATVAPVARPSSPVSPVASPVAPVAAYAAPARPLNPKVVILVEGRTFTWWTMNTASNTVERKSVLLWYQPRAHAIFWSFSGMIVHPPFLPSSRHSAIFMV